MHSQGSNRAIVVLRRNQSLMDWCECNAWCMDHWRFQSAACERYLWLRSRRWRSCIQFRFDTWREQQHANIAYREVVLFSFPYPWKWIVGETMDWDVLQPSPPMGKSSLSAFPTILHHIAGSWVIFARHATHVLGWANAMLVDSFTVPGLQQIALQLITTHAEKSLIIKAPWCHVRLPQKHMLDPIMLRFYVHVPWELAAPRLERMLQASAMGLPHDCGLIQNLIDLLHIFSGLDLLPRARIQNIQSLGWARGSLFWEPFVGSTLCGPKKVN